LNQIRLGAETNIFLFRILENYLVRGSDRVFDSYESFFQFADVTPYLHVSIGEWLLRHGVDSQYIERNLVPIFRVIYEQSSEINAFSGFVTLVSSVNAASAKHGNRNIVKAVFSAARVTLKAATPVSKVNFDNTTKTYAIYTATGEEEKGFDYVVLAAPIEFAKIRSDNIESVNKIPYRQFVTKSVTYVAANGINAEFFGGVEPRSVLSTHNSTAPFYSLSYQKTIKDGRKVYKIFSKTVIPRNDLDKFFVNVSEVITHNWEYTFPVLSPNPKFPELQLHDNFYYLNGLESSSSAMEISVIAGRNIAQLIAKKEGIRGINETFEISSKIPFATHINSLKGTLVVVVSVGLVVGIVHGYVYQRAGVTLAKNGDVIDFMRLYATAYVVGFWIEWFLYRWGVVTNIPPRYLAVMTPSEVLAGLFLAIGNSLAGTLTPGVILARLNSTSPRIRHYNLLALCGVVSGVLYVALYHNSLLALTAILTGILGGLTPQSRLLDFSLAVNFNMSYTILISVLIVLLPHARPHLRSEMKITHPIKWGTVLGLLQVLYALMNAGPSFHNGFGVTASWDPFIVFKAPLEWSLAVAFGIFFATRSASGEISTAQSEQRESRSCSSFLAGGILIGMGLALHRGSFTVTNIMFSAMTILAFYYGHK
jgi:hypothetical protein